MWLLFLTQKTSQKQAKPCPLTYGNVEVTCFLKQFEDSWMCFTQRPLLHTGICPVSSACNWRPVHRKTTRMLKWHRCSCLQQQRQEEEAWVRHWLDCLHWPLTVEVKLHSKTFEHTSSHSRSVTMYEYQSSSCNCCGEVTGSRDRSWPCKELTRMMLRQIPNYCI